MTDNRDVFANEIFYNNGFTYDPAYGFLKEETKDHFPRYIVSARDMYITPTDLERRYLSDMINTALREKLYVGAWRADDSRIYYDFSTGFDNIEEAIAYGKSHNQISIFDAHTKTVIEL